MRRYGVGRSHVQPPVELAIRNDCSCRRMAAMAVQAMGRFEYYRTLPRREEGRSYFSSWRASPWIVLPRHRPPRIGRGDEAPDAACIGFDDHIRQPAGGGEGGVENWRGGGGVGVHAG